MTLKIRVIPTLLYKGSCLVKGKNFASDRIVGSMQQAVRVYNRREVDELILLDVAATKERRCISSSLVSQAAKLCSVPLAVGGGVQNPSQAREILRNGADKVVINTALVTNPEGVSAIVNEFGSQCVIASVDVKRNEDDMLGYDCYVNSGSEKICMNLDKLLQRVESLKCGELIVNSIDRDGCMTGYDLELIKYCSNRVNLPTIASGGAKGCSDFVAVVKEGGASAVAAASIFHFTQSTPNDVKRCMNENCINVRQTFKS